jgi:hypothetical protein
MVDGIYKVIPTKNNEKIFTVKTFSYKGEDYEIVDVGNKHGDHLIFPTTYVVNLTKDESTFMTNGMKFGISDVKIDADNGEIHLYGYVWGQCVQWERYSMDGCYIGFIKDDGSYENVFNDGAVV